MLVYRAMCEKEYLKTLQSGKPDFLKRKKWFTHCKEFLIERVLDGEFNNSKFKEKYTHLVTFNIGRSEFCDWISNNEIQIDRRSLVTFEIISFEVL